MKMTKVKITIGIPAYNEEGNIGNLLRSIFAQSAKHYHLDQVIVMTDGSTDSTVRVVCDSAKQFTKIHLLQGKTRKGKNARLNRLFQTTQSSVLVCLDADIQFASENSLDNLIKPFYNHSIHLVSGNDAPLKTSGYFNQILIHNYALWYAIRHDLNGGDHIHNIHGSIYALRDDLYHNCRLSRAINADDHQIYFLAKQLGYSLHFAKDATFIYRLPSTIKEYVYQSSRYLNAPVKLAETLGSWVWEYFNIAPSKKISTTALFFLKHPFLTTMGTLLRLSVGIIKSRYESNRTTIWMIQSSTKLNINGGK